MSDIAKAVARRLAGLLSVADFYNAFGERGYVIHEIPLRDDYGTLVGWTVSLSKGGLMHQKSAAWKLRAYEQLWDSIADTE